MLTDSPAKNGAWVCLGAQCEGSPESAGRTSDAGRVESLPASKQVHQAGRSRIDGFGFGCVAADVTLPC